MSRPNLRQAQRSGPSVWVCGPGGEKTETFLMRGIVHGADFTYADRDTVIAPGSLIAVAGRIEDVDRFAQGLSHPH